MKITSHPNLNRLLTITATFLLAMLPILTRAATKTWDGSSSGNWATAANWSGGTAPVAGDDLVFPGGITRTNTTNNFSPLRAFNTIAFTGTNYNVHGGTLIVTNGIRSGSPQGDNAHRIPNTISADVQLGASQTFIVSNVFTKLLFHGNILLGSHTLTIDGEGDSTYDGVISGTGGIEKLGFGSLELAGDNTFSGPVNIRDGRLIADAGFTGNSVLGSTNGATTVFRFGLFESSLRFTNETLVLSGGTWLNNSSPGEWHGPVNVVSNSTVWAVGDLILDGVLSGTADLSIDTFINGLNAEMTLAGASGNTLTGEVWLQDGRLILDKSSGLAIDGPFKLGGGSTTDAVVRENQNNQIATVPITILTNAILDLDGHTDAIGGLTLVGGTLTNNGAGLCIINGDINAAYATRRSNIYGNISNGGSTRTFFVTNSDDFFGTELNIHDEVRGTGGLIKAGDGLMGLLASNSYSGLTTVSAGTLLVGDDFGLGSSANGTTVNSGATLFVSSSTIAEPLTLNGAGDTIEGRSGALRGLLATCTGPITLASDSTINVPSASPFNLTLSGPISGPGSISKTGPGTMIYSGSDDNVYTGDTFVNDGVLLLNKSGAFAINNSASLVIGDASDNENDDIVRYAAGNQLRTTVNIFMNHTGLLDLNGFTDDVGDISMAGGEIQTGSGVLQLRGDLTAIGDATDPSFFANQIWGNLDLGNNSRTFAVNDDPFFAERGILFVSAAISGSGGILKNGPGEIWLLASNSFSGAVTVNEGALLVGDDHALGATTGGVTVNNHATVKLLDVLVVNESLTLNSTASNPGALFAEGTTNLWTGNISLSSTARIGVKTNTTLNLGGVILGPGGLEKEGDGLLIFSGASANIYLGRTVVKTGTLFCNKSSANAIPGELIIGDGIGGSDADVVFYSQNQINDLSDVIIASSGKLLVGADTIGSLSGTGKVEILNTGELRTGNNNAWIPLTA